MDLNAIILLATEHKWIALSAVVVGFLVRLTKDDNVFPVYIDARWRPVVAAVLGVASGCLDAIANGTPWANALVGGVVAAALAALGHGAFVSALAGGKELPIPGLMVKPTEPPK